MTEEKITIQIQTGDHKINLPPDQAREVFHGLLAIFRGGADHYWWPDGKITTSEPGATLGTQTNATPGQAIGGTDNET